MTIRYLVVPLAIATALAVAGCGSDGETTESGNDGPSVVTAFYPLAFAAEQVAGGGANVVNLTDTGADAHDLELTAQQVGQISDADLVVYLHGFAPAVDEAIEQNADNTVDVTGLIELLPAGGDAHEHGDGHSEDEHSDDAHEDEHSEDEHSEEEHADEHDHSHDLDGDPHVWLDPSNMAAIGETVADELAELAPDAADAFHDRAHEFADELATLDEDYATGLADCERDTFVTSHAAFGYLADKYGLEMVGIAGIDPEIEPSPSRMAEVQEIVQDEDITTIFYERLVSPAVAESLADDVGVETAVLDPIESLTDETADENYFTLMRANLDALKEANGCA